ncbi:MAG TPA: glycosyltransferase family 9 protein [Chthoniobacteraceae bacterium]|nr:glycosyltransferase family 9 protein [Chthoniobacteraceae bacterium]
MKRRLLLLELWGLGDLTLSTAFIRKALEAGYEVDLVAKAYAKPLLEGTFPGLNFITYKAPWSAPAGKYLLWKWDWRELMSLLRRLRTRRYEAAVSVRWDPRDHLLLWLTGARRRIGFPRWNSQFFLTHSVGRQAARHKVEDWRVLGEAIGLPSADEGPRLQAEPQALPAEVKAALGDAPFFVLHAGAATALRRWPEAYYREILLWLRARYDIRFVLVPDPTGHGLGLSALADLVLPKLSLPEMLALFSKSTFFIGNDSGPGHVAAALGIPTLSIFGPGSVDAFRPWGKDASIVIRDICPRRPCFDSCPHPEPYCLTQLRPETVWPEIDAFVGRFTRKRSAG